MYISPTLTNRSTGSYTTILAVTLIPLYLISYRFRLTYPYGGSTTYRKDLPPSTNFVRDWLDVHVVAPFNPSAIGAVCNRTVWHPNLIFNLENANGGIGNVRGNMLDFIFFAIEAGAAIVLPGMASRSETDISNVWAARAPFDLMFDQAWFLSAMAQACPQMTIHQPQQEGEPRQLPAPLPGNYLPRSRRMDADQANTRAAYKEHLDSWLHNNAGFHAGRPTLVNLERTLWEIDTRSLPRGLRRNLGQLLRIKPQLRRLAAAVVHSLATTHALSVDPRAALPPQAFYGAHLRTEQDAQNAGWLNAPNTNFSAQTDAYMAHAVAHDLRVMYVATGNASELARFRAKAAAHRPPLTVVSKFDLRLSAAESAEMEGLSWDQQALIDYEVLSRCSVLGGFVKSSFSYNLAVTRGQWVEDWGLAVEPWRVVHEDPDVCFDDGVSRVVGRDGWHEMRIPRGMWP